MDDLEYWSESLLGIILNYPNVLDRINFSSDYFMNGFYGKVFNFVNENREIDTFKMASQFSDDEFKMIISYLVNNPYTKSHDQMALGYARLILEKYKNEMLSQIQDNQRLGFLSSVEYINRINDISKLQVDVNIDELTEEMLDEFITADNKGLKIKRFEILSNMLRLQDTDVCVIAAESGFGKSAFLLNIYQSLSQDNNINIKCHYFNLEVAPNTMYKRLLAITSDKKMDFFNKDNIKDNDVIHAKKKILSNNSYIESGSTTIEELKGKVLQNLDEGKINIVFVDHVGLLDTNEKQYTKSEYDRVTFVMKQLRNFALDNNLILFIASQFDRESMKSGKLSMHSLKSSGEIENSASHVLLLDKSENRYTEDESMSVEVMIKIAKNRNGLIGGLDNYTFIKDKQRFIEYLKR